MCSLASFIKTGVTMEAETDSELLSTNCITNGLLNISLSSEDTDQRFSSIIAGASSNPSTGTWDTGEQVTNGEVECCGRTLLVCGTPSSEVTPMKSEATQGGDAGSNTVMENCSLDEQKVSTNQDGHNINTMDNCKSTAKDIIESNGEVKLKNKKDDFENGPHLRIDAAAVETAGGDDAQTAGDISGDIASMPVDATDIPSDKRPGLVICQTDGPQMSYICEKCNRLFQCSRDYSKHAVSCQKWIAAGHLKAPVSDRDIWCRPAKPSPDCLAQPTSSHPSLPSLHQEKGLAKPSVKGASMFADNGPNLITMTTDSPTVQYVRPDGESSMPVLRIRDVLAKKDPLVQASGPVVLPLNWSDSDLSAHHHLARLQDPVVVSDIISADLRPEECPEDFQLVSYEPWSVVHHSALETLVPAVCSACGKTVKRSFALHLRMCVRTRSSPLVTCQWCARVRKQKQGHQFTPHLVNGIVYSEPNNSEPNISDVTLDNCEPCTDNVIDIRPESPALPASEEIIAKSNGSDSLLATLSTGADDSSNPVSIDISSDEGSEENSLVIDETIKEERDAPRTRKRHASDMMKDSLESAPDNMKVLRTWDVCPPEAAASVRTNLVFGKKRIRTRKRAKGCRKQFNAKPTKPAVSQAQPVPVGLPYVIRDLEIPISLPKRGRKRTLPRDVVMSLNFKKGESQLPHSVSDKTSDENQDKNPVEISSSPNKKAKLQMKLQCDVCCREFKKQRAFHSHRQMCTAARNSSSRNNTKYCRKCQMPFKHAHLHRKHENSCAVKLEVM